VGSLGGGRSSARIRNCPEEKDHCAWEKTICGKSENVYRALQSSGGEEWTGGMLFLVHFVIVTRVGAAFPMSSTF
jgi:hypothetical protein